MTTLAERLLERFQTLPADAQVEVIDFVEFLLARRRLPSGTVPDWSVEDQAMLAQQAMSSDDDPVTYDECDLRERWA